MRKEKIYIEAKIHLKKKAKLGLRMRMTEKTERQAVLSTVATGPGVSGTMFVKGETNRPRK